MTGYIEPKPYRPPSWLNPDAEASATDFWARRQAEYAEAEAQRPPELDVHAKHARMAMSRLHNVCVPCWDRKLAWMLAQPRGTHVRRHGERLAGIAKRTAEVGRP